MKSSYEIYEIAEKMYSEVEGYFDWLCDKGDKQDLIKYFCEVLDAVRKEAVKEALTNQKCKDCGCTYEGCCCNPIREMKARQEAFEEAKKLCKCGALNDLA